MVLWRARFVAELGRLQSVGVPTTASSVRRTSGASTSVRFIQMYRISRT